MPVPYPYVAQAPIPTVRPPADVAEVGRAARHVVRLTHKDWDPNLGRRRHGQEHEYVSTTADRPKEQPGNRTFKPTTPQQPQHEALWVNTQSIWAPFTKYDVTLRLGMGIADDLESRLEGFPG